MDKNRFTPATLGKMLFSIPLYQRLFEWDIEEIEQLLKDLKDSFEKCNGCPKPYYIGMLTIHDLEEGSGRLDLVDGQQRFTVMTLMAIALGWKDFYLVDGKLRLSFFAREQDENYIKSLCGLDYSLKDSYENKKMKAGVEFIKEYFKNINDDVYREDLKKYIKNNMTFFITSLPERYSLADLNKYFESMNSAGRPLENYEILKVKLLRDLSDEKEKYTRLWNVVADMNIPLIRRIKEQNENEKNEKIRERFKNALLIAKRSPLVFFDRGIKDRYLNDIYDSENNQVESDYQIIGDILAENKIPKPRELNFAVNGLFSFPLFLLLVLFQTIQKRCNDIQVAEFFKVGILLETFERYAKFFDIKEFLNNLVYYRLVLDYFFIRLREESYQIEFFGSDGRDEDLSSRSAKTRLVQYQSMLYVSSTPVTYYRWLNPAFDFIDKKMQSSNDVSVVEFLEFLKKTDNEIPGHSMPSPELLSYKKIDRYWFWRLDYYLWENSQEYFKGDAEALRVVNNYIFKRNRSIEHIAPQTPEGESNFKWDQSNIDYLNCFGNLAMISSGQNSLLLNKPYKEKQGHVKDFIYNNRNDSIESLKMLKIYQVENWNVEEIAKHQKEMMDVLEKSYERG